MTWCDATMSNADLWPLSYHLSGCTLLGATPQERLGALPLPLRNAVLAIAAEQAPTRFKCVFNPPTQLNHEGGQHLTYRYWRTEPDDLLARLVNLEVDRTPIFPSAEAYFQHYQLYPSETDDQDEHWAERQFIEQVFVPLCGLDGLRYLKPQVPFHDSRRVERRIDFVLDGEKRYALEIEGKTYHAGAERFDNETARRRELTTAGFHYFPISWGDVESGTAGPALQRLIEQDPLLRPLLEPTAAGDLLALAWLLSALPQRYPIAQRAALALLARAVDRGLPHLTVAEVDGSLPILTLALIDTLGLVERVADFYGIAVKLPELVAYRVAPRNPDLQERLLQAVLQTDQVPDTRLDAPRTAIRLVVVDTVPDDLPENAVIVADDRSAIPNARSFADLDGWGRRFTVRWPQSPDRLPAPAGLNRPTLDYFTRRYFQVPELKDEQIDLLQRTLHGHDAIGILPTGFGKSLVFQLYAILSPRVTLVISPLKALIQDQVGALRRLGWTCVDFILSTDGAAKKKKLADLFHSQRYRLFYIAPERLQIKTFYEELRASLSDTPLGALVIDEAHCVSEWGHDFRPAYLQIPRLRRLLEESAQRRIPLLALTATASPLVREDMLATLQLAPDDLCQTASSDRRNISLSVHPVPAQAGAKSQVLAHLLTEYLPRALGQPLGFDVFLESRDGRYLDAGIVFAMYADPHGKTTFAEGTPQIAAQLRQTLGLTDAKVQTHASRVPKVCPHPQCGSHDYWPASEQELMVAQVRGPALICRNCRQVFSQPRKVADWDRTLQQRHQAFQQDRFPLLVATKGFGMGIDKRNVSFVVHHAFASGLEGYYQEAGRAGRANQRAHVALLYIPPHEACLRDTIDKGEMPRCMTDPNAFRYRQCPHPYELPVLCDFSHQARFIQDSYPGVHADCETTYAVYKRLKAGQPLASQDDFVPPASDDSLTDAPDTDRKKTVYELALYRLQQLGIVQGYTLAYSGLRHWRFELEADLNWRPATLIAHVQDFLERSRRAPTEDLAEPLQILNDLAADCDAPPWPPEHHRPKIALLKKAIGTLLRRVYERVRAMRLQMLRDELDYVRAAEGKCRRVILLNRFNDKDHQVGDEHRCGFCDVCVPDLHFTQELATDAVGNVDLDEIVWRLNDLLQLAEPEPADLHNFIEQVQEHGVVLGMLARATRHLEGDPNSVPALYLAGALSWRIPTRQNQAMSYLRAGFQQSHQQGMAQETLLELFYRAGAEIDADEAVRWLNAIIPRFAQPADLLHWVQAWEPLLGRDSTAYRALYGIAKVRVLHRLSGPLKELKSLATGLQALPPAHSNRRPRHPVP